MRDLLLGGSSDSPPGEEIFNHENQHRHSSSFSAGGEPSGSRTLLLGLVHLRAEDPRALKKAVFSRQFLGGGRNCE